MTAFLKYLLDFVDDRPLRLSGACKHADSVSASFSIVILNNKDVYRDGKSNYMEGLMLVTLYLVISLACKLSTFSVVWFKQLIFYHSLGRLVEIFRATARSSTNPFVWKGGRPPNYNISMLI